jgi:hypothetical protein
MSVLCVGLRLMCITQHIEDTHTVGHPVRESVLMILRPLYPHPVSRIPGLLLTACKNSRTVPIFEDLKDIGQIQIFETMLGKKMAIPWEHRIRIIQL